MAVHDFWCQVCGQVLVDVNVPIAIGQTAGAPLHCETKTIPIPGVGRMDVGAVKGAAFKAFDCYDGHNNLVRVTSTSQLRRIERESEQLARDGEGQRMIWRRWSQDHSNRDVPTLGSLDGSERPDPEFVKRVGPSLKRSAEEPDATFGPGVHEGNTSALPMAGGE